MRIYIYKKHSWLAVLNMLMLLQTVACKKQLEVSSPVTDITSDRAFGTDGNAIATLTGLYNNMQSIFTGNNGLSAYSGLSADELTLSPNVSAPDRRTFFYTNNLFVYTSPASLDFWGLFYNHIYNCNAALTGLSASTALTPTVKKQLLGEALFMRAFYYYYLVTLYGDVPLVLTTDYKANALLKRTPSPQIWQQLVTDLDSAQHLLSSQYLDGSLLKSTQERVRPIQGAATALLARVYLYTHNWKEAETQSSLLINNTPLYSLNLLKDVFLKNSTEAIWQLQPVSLGWNTEDAKIFIIPSTGLDAYNAFDLNNHLLNSFEAGDHRAEDWIDSITVSGVTYYYPYKYKSATYGDPVTEYQMMLRLGEQYLIRSEARAQEGNLDGAREDLNVIRNRAGLPNTAAATQSAILTAVLQERRVEMFSELGQRWLDLKRTGTLDAVMRMETPLKANGAAWRSYQQLYPVPLDDIQANPNLTQNIGY